MKLALPVWLTEPAQITEDSGYQKIQSTTEVITHACVQSFYQHIEHVGFKRFFFVLFSPQCFNALYSHV